MRLIYLSADIGIIRWLNLLLSDWRDCWTSSINLILWRRTLLIWYILLFWRGSLNMIIYRVEMFLLIECERTKFVILLISLIRNDSLIVILILTLIGVDIYICWLWPCKIQWIFRLIGSILSTDFRIIMGLVHRLYFKKYIFAFFVSFFL